MALSTTKAIRQLRCKMCNSVVWFTTQMSVVWCATQLYDSVFEAKSWIGWYVNQTRLVVRGKHERVRNDKETELRRRTHAVLHTSALLSFEVCLRVHWKDDTENPLQSLKKLCFSFVGWFLGFQPIGCDFKLMAFSRVAPEMWCDEGVVLSFRCDVMPQDNS